MARIYKTQEAILNNAPKLTEKDIQQINEKCFKPYLFFEDGKEGREFWCSSCHSHFSVAYVKRTMTQTDHELLGVTHSSEPRRDSYGDTCLYHCPKCGAIVETKQTGRARHCNNLTSYKTFVHIKPKGEAVYLTCGYAYKEYDYHHYDWQPEISISTICYLAPGVSRMFKKACYSQWHESKRVSEPFTKTWWYNISQYYKPEDGDPLDYVVFGEEKLEKTFLKYCRLHKFGQILKDRLNMRYVQYLGVCAENPNTIEMMLKLGMSDFVIHKHNNFAERIPVIEEKIEVANHRIADLEHKAV